jgi:hypothetical protein
MNLDDDENFHNEEIFNADLYNLVALSARVSFIIVRHFFVVKRSVLGPKRLVYFFIKLYLI